MRMFLGTVVKFDIYKNAVLAPQYIVFYTIEITKCGRGIFAYKTFQQCLRSR